MNTTKVFQFRFTLCKMLSPLEVVKAETVTIWASNVDEAADAIRQYMCKKKQAGLTVMCSYYYHTQLKKFKAIYIPIMPENIFCTIDQ